MEQQGGNLILMAQDEPNSVSMWYSPNIKVLSAHENSVRLNRWTHIAYTVNSGTMTVYINGELSNSTTEVSAPQIQTGPVAIGKRSQAIAFLMEPLMSLAYGIGPLARKRLEVYTNFKSANMEVQLKLAIYQPHKIPKKLIMYGKV